MTGTEVTKEESRNPRLSLREEAVFFSHLALMFDSGVSIVKAFEVLARAPGEFSVVILSILRKLESGFGLRGAFQAHKESFSKVSLTLIDTGEKSGSLAPCLTMAARWAEKSAHFRSKMMNAVTYPAFVLAMNLLLTLAFLVWLVPAFDSMIDLKSATFLTLAVVTASDLACSPYFWVTILLVAAPVSLKLFSCLKRGNSSRYLVWIPLLGHLIKEIHRARYWMVFSFLHQAGSPLLDSLELAAQASHSQQFVKLNAELKEAIMRGESASEHFERHRQFYGSMLVAGMSLLTEGLTSSKLCESLNEHFQVEVETNLDKFHVVLEPLLISLVAVSTGLLLMGLYLPFGRFLQQVLVDGL